MVTEGEQLDQSLLQPLICLLQLLLLLFWLLLLPYCLLQCVQESRAIDPKLRCSNLKTQQGNTSTGFKCEKTLFPGTYFGCCHSGQSRSIVPWFNIVHVELNQKSSGHYLIFQALRSCARGAKPLLLSPSGNGICTLLSSLQIQEQFYTLKSGSALPFKYRKGYFLGKTDFRQPWISKVLKVCHMKIPEVFFFSALWIFFLPGSLYFLTKDLPSPPHFPDIAKPLTWTTCTSALKLQSSVVLCEATVCMGPLCREMGHYLCVRSIFCTIPGNHRILGAPSAVASPQQWVQEVIFQGEGE